MSRYIGTQSAYGLYEKQVITPIAATSNYQLLYRAGSPNALLVTRNGAIQEPGADYTLTDGNSKILFAYVPALLDRLVVLFLGRELSVPAVAGNELYRYEFTGDAVTFDFTLPVGPCYEQSLHVFKDGILQRFGDDWSLDITGYIVQFASAPLTGEKIDVYVLGVARNDLVTVPDGSISGIKLQQGIAIGTLVHPAGNSVFEHIDVLNNVDIDNDLNVLGTATVNDLTVTGSVVGITTTGNEQFLSNNLVVTTDATPTTILSIPLPNNSSTIFEAKIASRYNDNVTRKVYWASVRGGVDRINSGGATIISEPIIDDGNSNADDYVVQVSVFGNNLLIQVQGAVGETVHWSGHVKYVTVL
jgi:hypothetical protein